MQQVQGTQIEPAGTGGLYQVHAEVLWRLSGKNLQWVSGYRELSGYIMFQRACRFLNDRLMVMVEMPVVDLPGKTLTLLQYST